jgi:hypothetical protein
MVQAEKAALANHMFDMAVPFGHPCLDMKSLFSSFAPPR